MQVAAPGSNGGSTMGSVIPWKSEVCAAATLAAKIVLRARDQAKLLEKLKFNGLSSSLIYDTVNLPQPEM